MVFFDLTCFLYPLGFIANLFFGMAFSLQWWLSERRKQVYVPRVFWKLSFVGALLMIAHGFIQSQFPVVLLHAINLVIYFRNLNITSTRRISFIQTVAVMVFTIILSIFPFLFSTYIFSGTTWMALPSIFQLPFSTVKFYWHLIGCLGLLLFASRFLLQWWHIEFRQKEGLPVAFWQVGFVGSFLASIYFIRIVDPVNILSYSCGLFPPIANLRLLYKEQSSRPYTQDHCFLSAGEASGDILGANLIHTIKSLYPSTVCSGVGGPLMRAKGFQAILYTEQFQVSGFVEVFASFFKLFKSYRKILKFILQEKPGVVICIDFPDFHLLLIKKLRKCGYKGKIIQYVCPSIWAWRPKRKQILEKYVDTLLVILPFEQELFRHSPLKTVYLGHPLVEEITNYKPNPLWKEELSLIDRPIIAAFPGSRRGDIERNLRVQIQAFLSSSLARTHQLLVSSSYPKYDPLIRAILKSEACEHSGLVPATLRYELMRSCDCALAKCGTIVLEAALNSVPTIVTCRLRPIDTFLTKYVFKIFLPAYSLPNIITNSIIFPEFMGGKEDFHPDEIAVALELLMKGNARDQQRIACQKLFTILRTGIVPLETWIHYLYQNQESASSLDEKIPLIVN
ncbi:lipid-A-disaccharide synthase [Candidatus Chlamydia sanziniae]|uniref:Lipid-A-disaccharide synthase n=1 Tax=Candidatus Chlamydia sanziniae TaxID=1806891 RepID=A0A1A9HUU2_9CHLA|nr:lipid-A-disaccharide synthase [Candidatus Chlamydia sanziniae]ANH78758.1 Lipid-A-disaccharide synthase [Candidatus Chlamydia sanziniae]